MALSEVKRNEIAYMYIVREAENNPLPTLEVGKQNILRFMPNWEKSQLAHKYAHDILHAVFSLKISEHEYEPLLTEEELHAMSWESLLETKFREGIRIGDLNKRQVGNTAKKLGIPISNALEFSKLVATEIFNRTFSN